MSQHDLTCLPHATAAPQKSVLAGRRLADAGGFTLIELVTIMVLVGVLAFVAIPRLSGLRGWDDIAYRDKVVATLQYARKAAVAQRRDVTVTLAANSLSLTVSNVTPEGVGSGSHNLDLPSKDGDCAANNQICPRTGVTLAGPASLVFSPLGRPNAAATYTVSGDATHTVTVEAESGYVH